MCVLEKERERERERERGERGGGLGVRWSQRAEENNVKKRFYLRNLYR